MASNSDSTVNDLAIVGGFVAGVGAYFVGYLVTYLWKAQDIREALGPINVIAEFFGAEPVPGWKVVGWLYYSAHFVATEVNLGLIGPRYVDLIQGGEGNLELLYLVPPLVLFVAGFLLTIQRNDLSTHFDAIKIGGTVTLGYFICAVIGLFLFRVNGNGPDMVPALLLAGVIYPMLFGAVGGMAGQFHGDNRS